MAAVSGASEPWTAFSDTSVAKSARIGLLRVRGAHHLPVAGDGVFALKHLDQDGSGGHVIHQLPEEGT